jgi:hypothetical protein
MNFLKRLRKRYIPFNLKNSTWAVLDRKSGELVAQTNGLLEKYPEVWARNRAEQLNKGEPKCKA